MTVQSVAVSNFLFQLLASILLLSLLVESANRETVENVLSSHNNVYVIALLSIGVIVMLAATVLFLCGDCYKSEISSSTHAACGGNKRSGGEGYHITDTQDINVSVIQSSHTFGEAVNPSGNPGLPYSMMPTQTHTEQGLVGYESTPHTHFNSYSGGGVPPVNNEESQSESSHRDGGQRRVTDSSRMHVNPLEDHSEEPPPSYNEAVRSGR